MVVTVGPKAEYTYKYVYTPQNGKFIWKIQ